MATRKRLADSWCGVVLAAGKGVRMNSARPKVLHTVSGVPMLAHATNAVRAAGITKVVVVVPPGGDSAQEFQAAAGPKARLVVQTSQLGTARALLAARDAAARPDSILLSYGDAPLITPETISAVTAAHTKQRSTVTILTARVPDPTGFGRIVRDKGGAVTAIVEERDATAAVRAINEINSGCYAFDAEWIWSQLPEIPRSSSGEYFLTDVVAAAIRAHRKVATVEAADHNEVLGVNDRVQLAEAERLMRGRILRRLMLGGVSVSDPATTYVDAGVTVGADTVVWPNTHLRGATRIGMRCQIGPNAILDGVQVGDDSTVVASHVESSKIGQRVHVGSFSRLRAGTSIADDVFIGNCAEIKNSSIGSGTHIGHFSYTGDATLGARVNIGAGTVTCNYDGKRKHQTIIEDDVQIGSDTMLVAPIRIGAGARTGAGAVATTDVPPGATVVGVPARPIRPKSVKRRIEVPRSGS
ncbi:MAG: UDP-N-acetylglucosamine diphosphorylase/glucosamine-1-phosphate N-acetyltransferase [SAR202 cluster bacterium]|nr:UDP-N-acetylglucosamine diphosphorylase/glucosamine-1-phosphate N-acetyltransferase [SAR202 cluster bacterium]